MTSCAESAFGFGADKEQFAVPVQVTLFDEMAHNGFRATVVAVEAGKLSTKGTVENQRVGGSKFNEEMIKALSEEYEELTKTDEIIVSRSIRT